MEWNLTVIFSPKLIEFEKRIKTKNKYKKNEKKKERKICV